MRPPTPTPCFLLAALALASACGDDGGETTDEVITLDEASDEVWLTIQDAVERGDVVNDNDVAARLTSPPHEAMVPADPPATLTWEPARSTLRHGRTTGDFVWVHVACFDESAAPIDVVAIETTSWQIDADRWASITGMECTVSVVSAYVDRGIITEGPYQPSATSVFDVADR